MVWEDYRNNPDTSDIYGARVTPQGTVYDEGPVVRQEESQYRPGLARDTDGQMLLVYQGWAGLTGGKRYSTDRIWGKMNPSPGIEEAMSDGRRTLTLGPTIVRGVLFLPTATSLKQQAASWLLDISGRQVMALLPGANDVSGLAPGVYFLRETRTQAVRKVVITR